MPVLSHQNIANATAIPSAETVLAASPAAFVTPGLTQKVIIRGVINMLAGTGTTAVVVKVRRSALVGGAQVGSSFTHTLAATNNASIAFSVEDVADWLASPGNGGQYNVTVTQTGGSANGSVNQGDLTVESVP